MQTNHLEALTANLRELEGKRVSEGEPIRMSFYRVVGVGCSLVFHDILRFCQKTTAPEVIDFSMYPCVQYIYDAFY
jgi:hypothetical protein